MLREKKVLPGVGVKRIEVSRVNPTPNSCLERRFGFFEDPDHPLYQKFEWDWNEPWEYKTHIDKKNKLWTAELKISFKTLDVDPQKPGSMWTLNVGRNEFLENGDKGGCHLWSPNLETRTFHDIAAFGELVFK